MRRTRQGGWVGGVREIELGARLVAIAFAPRQLAVQEQQPGADARREIERERLLDQRMRGARRR
jgi:hypothetical protein